MEQSNLTKCEDMICYSVSYVVEGRAGQRYADSERHKAT